MSNIKAIRYHLEMTQQRFAERLGCTQSAVGQWERGESSPSVEVGKRVVEVAAADGLAVSLDHVYGLLPWPPLLVEMSAEDSNHPSA